MKHFIETSFFKRVIVLALILNMVTFIGGAKAFASAPLKRINSINGTITTISGTTLTVTTSGKTPATYTVDALKAIVFGAKPETVANLTAGEKIHVDGTVTGTTVVAEGIDIVPTMNIVHGTVSSISATGITLTVTSRHAKGQAPTSTTQTFAITSKTKIMIPGTKSATVSNVVVGDEVMIMVMSDSSATPTATVINDISLQVNKVQTVNKTLKTISL